MNSYTMYTESIYKPYTKSRYNTDNSLPILGFRDIFFRENPKLSEFVL